jgi:crotonobetainyl-CoA:carnitine CoA-transferase CaiB-like acyl-CoA transferase
MNDTASANHGAPGPLSGVTVVDLTRVLAGPFSTMILADMGARVIKIERPGRGDDTRQFGPPFLKDKDGNDTNEAAYYLAANRNKESITVNLADPRGQAIVRDLVGRSEFLVENFKKGDLAKYGLSYDDLKDAHPGLIYCSITGFGQTGPFAERAGYDFLVQAMGGLMSVTGNADDAPGGGPLRVGVPISDLLTGMYATIGMLGAWAHRQNTGAGQWVDLALLDATVATLANQGMNYLATGVSPGRIGNTHPNIVPYQAFATADGAIVVAIGNDRQFVRFADLIGKPELADDPRFETNVARVRNRDVLVPVLEAAMASRTSADWTAALDAAGLSCGPINTLEQVFDHPQVQARGMRVEMDHPLSGTVPLVGSPLKLSASPVSYRRHPPTLGEHTDAILAELGRDAGEIATLREQGVI